MIESEHDSVSGPGLSSAMLASINWNPRERPSAKRWPSAVGSVPCALRVSNGNPSASEEPTSGLPGH